MKRMMSLFAWILIASQWGISLAQAQDTQTQQQAPLNKTEGVIVSTPIFSQIVVFRIPMGWKPAYEKASATTYIMEFIPNDQKLDDWKEMISIQGFKNFAKVPNSSPQMAIALLATGIKKSCGDNFVGQFFGDAKIDSFNASIAFIGCANMSQDYPSGIIGKGKSDVGYYIVIKGDNEIYMIHRSARGAAFNPKTIPISQATLDGWASGLLPIKICERNPNIPTTAPQSECWDRPAR